MEYIKVCGLRNLNDMNLCVKCGATALGFIYNIPESVRNLDTPDLQNLLAQVPNPAKSVIVLMPADSNELERLMQTVPADYYQVYINFDFQELNKIQNILRKKLIIGLKLSEFNIEAVSNLINSAYDDFFAFLIDNSEGTGKPLDINLIEKLKNRVNNKTRLIISGGINTENIEEVLKKLNPYGIDLSSSLESSKGIKDPQKIKMFFKECKQLGVCK